MVGISHWQSEFGLLYSFRTARYSSLIKHEVILFSNHTDEYVPTIGNKRHYLRLGMICFRVVFTNHGCPSTHFKVLACFLVFRSEYRNGMPVH